MTFYLRVVRTKVLVAQLEEHKAENLGVAGSSPVQNICYPPTNYF